jgi:hypothetical protein
MENKKCNKCNKCQTEKCETEFSFKDKTKGRRSTICNECQREYKNKWYHSKPENKENFKYTRQKTKNELRAKMIEFLKNEKCVDCGEEDIVTFEFDHKDVKEKSHNISTMIGDCFSWDKILEEISKCDIRCANCHRKKTAKQFGYYRILK